MAGAIGPVLMGRAFDTTASYQGLAMNLSVLTFFAAGLMLAMPAYRAGYLRFRGCARRPRIR